MLSGKDEIPLENESVDLLITVDTLHEIPDKNKIIEEIRRVLRPKGQAVIVDFKKEGTGFGPPITIRVSQDQARHLFEEKGLTALKSHEVQHHYLIDFRRV